MPRTTYAYDFRNDGRLAGRLEVQLENILDRADVYRVILQDQNGGELINDLHYHYEITPRQIDQPSATRHRPREFEADTIAWAIVHQLSEPTQEPRVLTDEEQEYAWDVEDVTTIPDDPELPRLVFPEPAKLWATENADALTQAMASISAEIAGDFGV
jgi:hypothetical protein